MRVHPTILAPKASKYQFAIAFSLLAFLLIINIVRGPRQSVVAELPNDKRIDVVIASKAIEAGLPLEQASLVLEQRPISTLPADAITTFEAIKGKVAAGPIPAGYPLATVLLADPVALVATQEAPGEEEILDPVEALLSEIEADTVAIPIEFSTEPPGRGSRIAIGLSGPSGHTVMLIEDAWIFGKSTNVATVRMGAKEAVLFQDARKYGKPSFFMIPIEGNTPFEGQGIKTIEELERKIKGESAPPPKAAISIGSAAMKFAESAAPLARRSFRSYAWVSGAGIRYGIDETGAMHIVDADGLAVAPKERNLN